MFLNPYLKPEEEDFYNTVKDFAREKVLPSVLDRDKNHKWDETLWQEMGSMGLNGMAIPEQYGGQGATCLQCCHASEAFNAGSSDGGLGLAWGAHIIIGTMPIVLFGNEEQKQKYLPKLATGEWVAGLGLTEPGSGSDAASMITRAKQTDKGFVINGSKMFITNGPIGHVFIVMARTGEKKSRSPMGISAFIVEKNFSGFSVSKVLDKLGHNTSTTAELVFEDMIVPKENLLGPLHSGFMRIGKATLEWERTVLIAAMIGGSEFIIEKCLRYANERIQFGKKIGEFYAIQEKIVKMWVTMQAGRRLLYGVARQKDAGASLPMESSLLKLFASETGEEMASEAVQVHGGYGYMKEYHVERNYRDIKLGTIGGGTSEVQRSIIAASFGNMQTFQEKVQKLAGNSDLQTAQQAYPKSLYGKELELMQALEAFLEKVSEKLPKKPGQHIEFALADLILIVTQLKLSFYDVAFPLPTYSIEEKKRDFALLAWYLMGKYFYSVKTLSSFAPQEANEISQCYFGLTNIEDAIHSCYEMLCKGIL
ncbi:MAG: acyl-CoA dehydrogenase [Candidatus Hydrogenedentota bacterium]|nr:MAG: acyl-CoA dehydrogenase [Candidatus Hydrogenedentota bacterium]